MTGDHDADLWRFDVSARGFNTADLAIDHLDAMHGAFLDDVDPQRVSSARIAPGNRVMACCSAAPLQGGADHRVAPAAPQVDLWTEFLHLLGIQDLAIYSIQAVGVD